MLPSPRLVRLALLWLISALGACVWVQLATGWLVASGVLLVVILGDALLAVRGVRIEAHRRLPGSAPLNVWTQACLRLSNHDRLALSCQVFDHHPAQAAVEGLPLGLALPAGAWAELSYRLRPVSRGDLHFGPVELRLGSPLRLWQRRMRVGEPGVLRVYPNFAALTRYALFATDNRLAQIGILQRRRRGEGLDFDQLREYREGDSQRKIDWKASQRLQKLISREYQDERDQQVVFLIDCGRRMRAKDEDCSHFDHALDAVLLLAYVSLRQGDAVGLMTMSGQHLWVAPRKSQAMVSHILNQVYGLQPGLLTSDYHQAAVDLARRLHKRALVVLISNLRDEDDESLLPALRLLQKRHLVLFVSLRERALDEAVAAPVENLDDALTHAAAVEYRRRRDAAFARLKRSNVMCLDVAPQRLALALVNQYLDVKRSGRL
ncbi:MAG TPA: DUF58 domain-containing protein [Burkholderiales bacterium]|nr:DUF58 domain-containing protein [Burkholderiales bacterium]